MTDSKNIPVKSVGSLPEFLQHIEEQCAGERNVLFRGHTDSSWLLEPKIARFKLRNRFSLPRAESVLLRDFKRQALPHLARDLQNDWD